MSNSRNAVLDFDGWTQSLPAGQQAAIRSQLEIASDREAEKRHIANILWISERAKLPASKVARNYDATRAAFSTRAGWAPETYDPVKFHGQVLQEAAKERDEETMLIGKPGDTKDAIAARESSMFGAAWNAGTSVKEDGEGGGMAFAKWQESAKNSPSYRPQNAERYYFQFMQQYNDGQAEARVARDAAQQALPVLLNAEGRGDVSIAKAVPFFRKLSPNQKALAVKYISDAAEQRGSLSAGDGMGEQAMTAIGRGILNTLGSVDRGFARDRLSSLKFEAGQFVPEGADNEVISSFMTTGNPGKPLVGEGNLTEARAAALNARVKQRLDDLQIESELTQLAQGKINPLSRQTWQQKMVIGASESIGAMGIIATPVGLPAMINAYRADAEEKLVSSGIPLEKARGMSMVIGAAQGALDRVSLGLLKKMPGLNNLLSKWSTNGVLKAIGRTAGVVAGETAIELTQDQVVPALVQDVANMWDASIPDVSWSKVGKETWAQTPDTLLAILPLALLGAGGATLRDMVDANRTVNDPVALEALGFSPSHIAAISLAADIGDGVKVFKELWKERTPKISTGDSVPASPPSGGLSNSVPEASDTTGETSLPVDQSPEAKIRALSGNAWDAQGIGDIMSQPQYSAPAIPGLLDARMDAQTLGGRVNLVFEGRSAAEAFMRRIPQGLTYGINDAGGISVVNVRDVAGGTALTEQALKLSPISTASTAPAPAPASPIEEALKSFGEGALAATAARVREGKDMTVRRADAIAALRVSPVHTIEDNADGSVRITGVLDPVTKQWVGKAPSPASPQVAPAPAAQTRQQQREAAKAIRAEKDRLEQEFLDKWGLPPLEGDATYEQWKAERVALNEKIKRLSEPAPTAPDPAIITPEQIEPEPAALRRDDHGWKLVFPDGREAQAGSLEAAEHMRSSLRRATSEKEALAMVGLADEIAARSPNTTQVFSSDVLKVDEGDVTRVKLDGSSEAVTFETKTASNLNAQLAHLGATSGLIQGSNWIRQDGQRILESNQTRDGVFTQVHEFAESRFRDIIAQDGGALAVQAARVAVNTGLFNPEKQRTPEDRKFAESLHNIANGKTTETEARETLVELAISDALGRRREGRYFSPGVIADGVSQMLRGNLPASMRKTLSGVMALLKAARAYVQGVFSVAAKLKRARREGKIVEGDALTTLLDQMLGVPEQRRHNEAVLKESGLADGAAFSINPGMSNAPGAAQQQDSTPPGGPVKVEAYRGAVDGDFLPSRHRDGIHWALNKDEADFWSGERENGSVKKATLTFQNLLDFRNVDSKASLIAAFRNAGIPSEVKINPYKDSQNSDWNKPQTYLEIADLLDRELTARGGWEDFNPNMDLTDNLGGEVKSYVDGIAFNEHGNRDNVAFIALHDSVIEQSPAPSDGATFDLASESALEIIARRMETATPNKPEARLTGMAKAAENLKGIQRAWLYNDSVNGPFLRTQAAVERQRKAMRKTREAELLQKVEEDFGNTDEIEFLASPTNSPVLAELFRKKPSDSFPRSRIAKRPKGYDGGDYDGAAELPGWLFGGSESPDTLAQELYDAGLIRDAYPDTMWTAVESALKTSVKMKDTLKQYRERRAEAKQQARDEANAWAESQNVTEEDAAAQKKEVTRSLVALDGILMPAPAEVRGKVGGFVALSKLTTDAARLRFLLGRVDKMVREYEKWLRGQYTDKLEKLIDRANDTSKPGEKARGAIGPQAHRFFAAVGEVVGMGAAQVEAKQAELENELTRPREAGEADLTDDEAANIFEKQQVLDLFGNLKDKNAAELAKAYEAAQTVYKEGRNRWRIAEEARLAEVRAIGDGVIAALGGAGYKAIQGSKENARSLKAKANSIRLELKNLGGFLKEILGENNEIATRWTSAARNAMQFTETARRGLKDEWKARIEEATGKKGRAARLEVWNMVQNQSIDVVLAGAAKSSTRTVPESVLENIMDGTVDPRDVGLTRAQADELIGQAAGKPLEVKDMSRGPSENVKLTESEGIFITMLAAQEQYEKGLDAAGFTGDVITAIEESLSPAAKTLRAWMRGKYADNYKALNSVFSRMFGVDLAQIENYAPAAFYHTGDANAKGPEDSTMQEGGFRSNFLKTRKKHRAAPRLENAFAAFFGHAAQSAHWQGFAELVREMRGVMSRPDVKMALEGRHGREVSGLMSDWLKNIEGNGISRAHGALDAFTGWLLRQAAYVHLAYNVGTLVVQSTAALGAAWKIGAGQYMRGLGKLMTGRLDVKAMWNSDLIQNRLANGYAPEVRAALNDLWSAKPSRRQDFLEKGMELIGFVDAFWTTGSAAIAYDAHYRDAIDAGMSEESAKAIAMARTEETVGETAQPSTITEKSLFEAKQGNIAKLAFLYASESRQKTAMLVNAWKKTFTGKASRQDIQVLILAHLVLGPALQFMRAALRDMKDDDDEDVFDKKHWQKPSEWMYSILLGPLNGIPLVGDLFSGYASDNAAVGRFKEAGSSAISMLKGPESGTAEKGEWYWNRVARVLKGLDAATAVTAGVADQVFKTADNFAE